MTAIREGSEIHQRHTVEMERYIDPGTFRMFLPPWNKVSTSPEYDDRVLQGDNVVNRASIKTHDKSIHGWLFYELSLDHPTSIPL